MALSKKTQLTPKQKPYVTISGQVVLYKIYFSRWEKLITIQPIKS